VNGYVDWHTDDPGELAEHGHSQRRIIAPRAKIPRCETVFSHQARHVSPSTETANQ